MKLIENAKVTKSGAYTTEIGVNQVVITATEDDFTTTKATLDTVAKFLEVKKSVRNEQEKTYGDGNEITAYVPADVANVASLNGKTVDVIFGKDNIVAYIVVTDNALDAAYVTAWDTEDDEIEIDGIVYDFADEVELSVFNYPLDKDASKTEAAAIVDGLMSSLDIADASKYMTRNVIAEIVVDNNDEIEKINFKFSADYEILDDSSNELFAIDEYIVKKISSKNVWTTTTGKFDAEKVEDEDEPRVIRNGEIATLFDIEVGDVVTEVRVAEDVSTIIAVANTFDGVATDYTARTNALKVDGEKYVVAIDDDSKIFHNTDGEVEEISLEVTSTLVKETFKDETVTFYVNMVGEVVAMVAETEATGTTLGVITDDYSNELFEDSSDVLYAKIRVLTADGSNKIYKIYNDTTSRNVDKDDDYTAVESDLTNGTTIYFEANADRVIKASKIKKVEAKVEGYKFGSVEKITASDVKPSGSGDIDVEKDLIKDKKFTSSTVVINPAKKEVISNFDALIKDDAFVDLVASTEFWMFTKGNKIIYIVASIDNYGTSTDKYGILVDTGVNTDDEGCDYVATILVDGVAEKYECEEDLIEYFELGDMIAFNVVENEIVMTTTEEEEEALANAKTAWEAAQDDADLYKAYVDSYIACGAPQLLVAAEFVNDIETLADDEDIVNTNISKVYFANIIGKDMEFIKVAEGGFDGESIVFEATDAEVAYLAEDCVIYNLAEGDTAETIDDGEYVLLANANTDGEYQVVIIVK